jgi:hypothetical protein
MRDTLGTTVAERKRHGEAERRGGREIEEELQLRGPLDRQVGWLLALENSAGIDAGLPVGIGNAAGVTH